MFTLRAQSRYLCKNRAYPYNTHQCKTGIQTVPATKTLPEKPCPVQTLYPYKACMPLHNQHLHTPATLCDHNLFRPQPNVKPLY